MPVATPISRGQKPIQIRAEALRNWQAPFDTRRGFAMMSDDAAKTEKPNEAPAGAADWRDDDLKRAIAAAEEAGLRSYRAEIAPDGTISIIVGDQPKAPGASGQD